MPRSLSHHNVLAINECHCADTYINRVVALKLVNRAAKSIYLSIQPSVTTPTYVKAVVVTYVQTGEGVDVILDGEGVVSRVQAKAGGEGALEDDVGLTIGHVQGSQHQSVCHVLLVPWVDPGGSKSHRD